MTPKQLMLHEVSLLQSNYTNLIKAHELANADWDKEIILKIASNLLVSIGNIMDVVKNMK